MSDKYRIIECLTKETLEPFDAADDNFFFKGATYWKYLDKHLKAIIEDRNFCSLRDVREYFKCYVIPATIVIGRKYPFPDNTRQGEFQIGYLHEIVAHLRRYYEYKPYKRFFKKFTSPPPFSEETDTSIRNWLKTKASLELSTMHTNYVKKCMEQDGINFDAYKEALKEAEILYRQGKKFKKVDINDFREKGTHSVKHIQYDYVKEFLGEEYATPPEDISEYEKYLLSIPKSQEIEESEKIESYLKRLNYSHKKRMENLLSTFLNNSIYEIQSSRMWEIQYRDFDAKAVWLIFHAQSENIPLNVEGKEFLLHQYLIIALAHLKDIEDFHISSTGTSTVDKNQMYFLTLVIAQTYTHFNNHYDSKILGKVGKMPGDDKVLQEDLFEIFSKFIKSKVNEHFSDYTIDKKDTNEFQMMEMKSSAIKEKSNIQSTFSSYEEFTRFIHELISYNDFPSIIENDEINKRISKNCTPVAIKNILKPILKALGYEILDENETDCSLFYIGTPGKFKDQRGVALNSKIRNERCALYIEKNKKLTFEDVIEINKDNRSEKARYTTIVSIPGFENVMDFREDKSREAIEYRWTQKYDMRKMMSMIKNHFPVLSDIEFKDLLSQVNELIQD